MEDFSFDDDETEPQEQESKPFQDLRKHARTLERQLKQLTSEAEELRQFKATYDQEQAERKATEVFSELGLDPKRASWFKADNPDAEIAKETVQTWAATVGLIEVEQADEPAPRQGFSPTVVADAVSVDAKTYSVEEITELYARDPEKVKAMYQKNRLNLPKLEGSTR